MVENLIHSSVNGGVRGIARTPPCRVIGRWAILGCLAGAQVCFGFELVPHDPLSQLGSVPTSPASAMMASSVASHGCSEASEATYTLLDVVENALCHNPKTRVAWANVQAQAAQVGVAKAAYLPTLTGSVQAIRDHTTSQGTNVVPFSIASDSNYHNDTLTLNWVLYDFGLRSSTVDNAEKMLASAMASQDNALQTVFATAVKDYYAALIAQKNIRATIEIEEQARDVLNAATVRVQKGIAAISDQLQAKTAYSQAVFNHNKAEGDWRSALGILAIDMGQRPDDAAVLIESDMPSMSEPEMLQSVGELLQSAQKVHPALIAARADMEAAQANEQMVRAQGRPSLSLVGRYNVNNQSQSSGVGQPYIRASGRDRYIGVQLDIPFFEGFGRTYKIRTAQAQVEGKEASLADAELQVAASVWTSYQSLKVSAGNLHTAQDILDSAHDAFKVAESRYQKGVANILEVLTTQTALANAQQQQIQAVAEWQNARVQLAASVGRLSLGMLH